MRIACSGEEGFAGSDSFCDGSADEAGPTEHRDPALAVVAGLLAIIICRFSAGTRLFVRAGLSRALDEQLG